MSNDNSQFAWQVHSYLSDYIKFGDTKAALIAGLAGPLVFGLIGFSSWTLAFDWKSCLGLLAMLLFAIAFCFAFAAIWPNLFTSDVKRTKKRPTAIESDSIETPDKGFIFWRNIRAHANANTFAIELAKLTDEDRLQHLGKHCYELAGINDRKYWFVTIASRFFAAGIIALTIFAAIHWSDRGSSDERQEPVSADQSQASCENEPWVSPAKV